MICLANEDVTFRRGPAATMPTNIVPGTLLVQTDTHDVFLDDTTTSRIQLGDSTKLPLTGGTLTGDLNLSGHRLTNIATPSDSTDAATKGFVDTAFQTIESELATSLSGYLPLKGGTLTGQINMNGNKLIGITNPVADTDAANKYYVDSRFNNLSSSYLPLTGGTLTGQLHMSGTRITNVGTPTTDTDAATKSYVDTNISSLSNKYLSLDGGGSIMGNLDLNGYIITGVGTPRDGSDAVNKIYVDNQINSVNSKFSNYLPLSGGTMTGQINMNSQKLTGLSTPSNASDAATKAYVDSQFAGSGTGDFLSNGSVPMTGNLQMGNHLITNLATPSNSTDAANKSYVDSQVETRLTQSAADSRYVNISGDTMTGALSMGANKITGLATPTENTDAATKAYVDSQFAGSGTGDFLASGIVPMTGNLQMGSHKIVNLATPTDGTDATNKTYVDSQISTVNSKFGSYLPLTGGTLTGKLSISGGDLQIGDTTVRDNDSGLLIQTLGTSEAPKSLKLQAGVSGTSTVFSISDGLMYTNGARISGLPLPTGVSEATNKQYVDNQISSIADVYAPISHTHTATQVTGLTANRALISNSSGNPAVSDITSTELGYLDGVTSNIQTQLNAKAASNHTHSYLPLSGGTLTGALNMSSQKITSLAVPTESTDAANKSYVDSQISSNAKTYTGTTPISVSGTTISHSTAAGYKHIPSGGSTGQVLRYQSSGTAQWGKETVSGIRVSAGTLTVSTDSDNIYTISHSTAAGYKHIPSGGSTNQYLKWSSSGTAVWAAVTVDDGVLS